MQRDPSVRRRCTAASAVQRPPTQQRGEAPRRVDRLGRAVGRARALAGVADRLVGPARVRQRDRRELHQRPVAGRARVGVAREGLAGPLEALQRGAGRVADVEAACRCSTSARRGTSARSAELVDGVERPRSTSHSARQSAIDVSSVHAPAGSANGPPPTMSVTGANVPGGLNSTVVPTASPTASPTSAPRKRSRRVIPSAFQCQQPRSGAARAAAARRHHPQPPVGRSSTKTPRSTRSTGASPR